MTVEEIAADAAAESERELAAAETDLARAEAALVRAREEVAVALTRRAALQEALVKVGPASPAAPRLQARIFELRHAQNPTILAKGILDEAKRRVARLQQEHDQLRLLAVPPREDEPADAEALSQDVLH